MISPISEEGHLNLDLETRDPPVNQLKGENYSTKFHLSKLKNISYITEND